MCLKHIKAIIKVKKEVIQIISTLIKANNPRL